MKPFRLCLVVALVATPLSSRGHESPIDHVERELRLSAVEGKVRLVYRLLPTERATLMELREMDADGDGTIAAGERDAFFAAKARAIAERFDLKIGDHAIRLEPGGAATRDPQLGQTFVFVAALPALEPGRHPGRLIDGHSRDYPGGFRWRDAGAGRADEIRFVPVTPGTDPRSRDHPPWLELLFEVVVP